jgi:acid stress chaperone HdeB
VLAQAINKPETVDMLKLLAVPLLAGLALTTSTGADARKGESADIDFGRITCQAFMKDLSNATEEDAGAIFLWLDGYLSGVSGDTTLRWQGMSNFAEQLVARCQKRGREPLLDAARAVGINQG